MISAALDVTPRIVMDPVAGYRYVRTVASRFMALQCSLMLRALTQAHPDLAAETDTSSNVRSIA